MWGVQQCSASYGGCISKAVWVSYMADPRCDGLPITGIIPCNKADARALYPYRHCLS